MPPIDQAIEEVFRSFGARTDHATYEDLLRSLASRFPPDQVHEIQDAMTMRALGGDVELDAVIHEHCELAWAFVGGLDGNRIKAVARSLETVLLTKVDPEAEVRVLDVGAGNGLLAGVLARRFPIWHFTAMEPDPRVGACLAEACDRLDLGNVTVARDQLGAYGSREPFDLVLTSAVVDEIVRSGEEAGDDGRTAVRAALARIAKLLASGGRYLGHEHLTEEAYPRKWGPLGFAGAEFLPLVPYSPFPGESRLSRPILARRRQTS